MGNSLIGGKIYNNYNFKIGNIIIVILLIFVLVSGCINLNEDNNNINLVNNVNNTNNNTINNNNINNNINNINIDTNINTTAYTNINTNNANNNIENNNLINYTIIEYSLYGDNKRHNEIIPDFNNNETIVKIYAGKHIGSNYNIYIKNITKDKYNKLYIYINETNLSNMDMVVVSPYISIKFNGTYDNNKIYVKYVN